MRWSSSLRPSRSLECWYCNCRLGSPPRDCRQHRSQSNCRPAGEGNTRPARAAAAPSAAGDRLRVLVPRRRAQRRSRSTYASCLFSYCIPHDRRSATASVNPRNPPLAKQVADCAHERYHRKATSRDNSASVFVQKMPQSEEDPPRASQKSPVVSATSTVNGKTHAWLGLCAEAENCPHLVSRPYTNRQRAAVLEPALVSASIPTSAARALLSRPEQNKNVGRADRPCAGMRVDKAAASSLRLAGGGSASSVRDCRV
jgi:hypothetical protein